MLIEVGGKKQKISPSLETSKEDQGVLQNQNQGGVTKLSG